VTQDDLLYRFRLRTFAMAAELGNVRAARRAMGIHPSTHDRWKRQLDRHGPEILRPRERRVPRMANQTSVLVEQPVVAFALGHPGFGPARIAAELAQPRWGAIQLSTNGVWRVLGRHGLSTRARRYGLVAGYAAPPAPSGRHRHPSGTWTSTTPASWSSSTAYASAASRAPRGPCGSTPPSMWPPPPPGPPSRSPGATPRPAGPAPWPDRWPLTWPPAAGNSSG
jgi:helix-turn-helix protein